MREPTSQECSDSASWADDDFVYLAFWWPQMGGYHAKAIAFKEKTSDDTPVESCVTVCVWHDGAFPFTEDDRDFDGNARSPAVIHICDFSDWTETMNKLSEFQYGAES